MREFFLFSVENFEFIFHSPGSLAGCWAATSSDLLFVVKGSCLAAGALRAAGSSAG